MERSYLGAPESQKPAAESWVFFSGILAWVCVFLDVPLVFGTHIKILQDFLSLVIYLSRKDPTIFFPPRIPCLVVMQVRHDTYGILTVQS